MNEQEKQERREMLDKWASEKSLEEIECHLATITERIYKLVEQHRWDLERYELYRDHLFQIRDSRLMVG